MMAPSDVRGRQPTAAAPWLVLGVMTAPANVRNRDNVRSLSHAELGIRRVHAVFVLGDVACARGPIAAEARTHSDFVFVNSSDCAAWHRAAKVQAWFELAVARWPTATWYGKSEDDGLVRISALMRDLAALHPSTEPWYYGIMAWTGSCTAYVNGCPATYPSQASGTTEATSREERLSWDGCTAGAGCYGGSLQPHPQESSPCREHQCGVPRCSIAGPCTRANTLMVPFAIGPLEVRSRALALAVAECHEARRYMRAISALGDARADSAGGRADPGASMDGGQALPLAMCVRRALLADATWKRMSYTASAVRNSRGKNTSVLAWTHPAKQLQPAAASRVWQAYASLPYVPAQLHTYELLTPSCDRSALPAARCAHGKGGRVSLNYRAALTPTPRSPRVGLHSVAKATRG